MRGRKPMRLSQSEKYRISYAYRHGASITTIARRFKRDRGTVSKVLAELGVPRREDKMTLIRKSSTREQLCWYCQRAAAEPQNQCSWARSFEPVDGWTATETICDRHAEGNFKKSFKVDKCPLFVKEPLRKKEKAGVVPR